MSRSETMSSPCPICGKAAELGCLYGPDGGSGLRWMPGPATAANNLWSAVGEGEPVGTIGFLAGPYASGLHCRSCAKIILNDQPGE